MADFRHYQPHRSSRAMPWRRWLVTLAVVVVVVLLGKAVFGGHKNNKKNSPTNSGGISLVTDNTNSPSANTNDASNTNSLADQNVNANVNATPAVSGDVLQKCPTPVSQYGTAKNVALTFDMSAANDNAKKILTSLQASKTPASWFSTGTFASKNKDFVTAVSAAGFHVYNHGQESKDYTTLTADQISGQITDADAVIRTATHTSTQPFFRPPFGDTNAQVTAAAKSAGYCVVLWTVDAFDWQDGMTVDQAKQRVLDKARPGAIILLHAGYDITPALLESLRPSLTSQGYHFVTLSTLMAGA